jgi:hypothetical protein
LVSPRGTPAPQWPQPSHVVMQNGRPRPRARRTDGICIENFAAYGDPRRIHTSLSRAQFALATQL